MKFLPLIWRNLWRRKVRTIFTLASIFIAFLLFGLLMTIRASFSLGVELAGVDRLTVVHKTGLIMTLPVSYKARLQAVRGVEAVTHNTWFGGIYQNPRNFFAQVALEPDAYLTIYPEVKVAPEQMKAWLADRQGAIAGRDLAERYGWKIGDRIPIQGTYYRPKTGGATWEFNLVGTYEGKGGPTMDNNGFFFRYDYLDENRQMGAGEVGWYVVKIQDSSQSREMAASFDALFANSPAETKTTTEKGFLDGFAKQVGDIGSIMVAILTAVLFTILLVVGNTMAQAVRERTNELAVLKTLGFSSARILMLVLAESLFIAGVGGGLGLALAWLIVQAGDPTGGLLGIFELPRRDLMTGVWLIVGLGVVAGAVPALGAMRIKITDALRKV
jgi:putative ABC transport system permease protein